MFTPKAFPSKSCLAVLLTAMPSGFAESDGTVVFAADDGVSGCEPWRYDGAVASLLMDINPGPGGSLGRFTNAFATVGGAGFFHAGWSSHLLRGE
jgi:ELWxxDGT repeat protein